MVFLVCVAGALALMGGPVRDMVLKGRPKDYYTHIPLIPAISAYVLFKRKDVLCRNEPGSPLGGLAIAGGLGLVVIDTVSRPGLVGRAELVVTGAVLILAGTFLALFGKRSFRRTLFPFLFLVFMIPLPASMMSAIVSALVTASTGMTSLLFKALGVPFVQEGAYFHLPVFDIEVAQECSGIRSSIALAITTVLAGHIFLDKFWKKVLLVLAVFPVTVLKNGVRILSLYLLSYFIDIKIIEGGFLHRSGGFIFFGLGLVILGYVLWILRKPSSVTQADRD